jgi:hypothetical protein
MSATLDSVGVLDGSTYVTARAWVNFAGSSGSIRASYNVSSVTRRNVGRWTVNLSSGMVNANYIVGGLCGTNGGGGATGQSLKIDDFSVGPTASAVPVSNVGAAYVDSTITTVVIHR